MIDYNSDATVIDETKYHSDNSVTDDINSYIESYIKNQSQFSFSTNSKDTSRCTSRCASNNNSIKNSYENDFLETLIIHKLKQQSDNKHVSCKKYDNLHRKYQKLKKYVSKDLKIKDSLIDNLYKKIYTSVILEIKLMITRDKLYKSNYNIVVNELFKKQTRSIYVYGKMYSDSVRNMNKW